MDFCDGLIFKEHPMFGSDPYALQIISYFDELEVVNPIVVSYVSKHKLGCIFFILGNIRPRYLSLRHPNVWNGHISVSICWGFETLFCDRISVSIGGENRKPHALWNRACFLGRPSCRTCSRLFQRSMSFALRICRTCLIAPEQSQLCLTEANCQRRNPATHLEQCQLGTPRGSLFYQLWYKPNLNLGEYALESIPGFSVVTSIPMICSKGLCRMRWSFSSSIVYRSTSLWKLWITGYCALILKVTCHHWLTLTCAKLASNPPICITDDDAEP